ncbi:potassium channel family protein [Meiothermus hypogaeus]|uniref:Trk system potassium uptake protein TrkA n=2 Tax=Meiothermus hypogaeus TaxID=884155 RepID=A0A511QXC2_9DEIN|nr:TrkA family potassium uptake protein [Meiothermus hypogaeus]RIH77501.1 Trk system potassium uptake protein TrkA [Meiothermus hypogaeus]GEM82029.1 potassium uptake protein TrkA [Meiothermus hypogaeus NBRC 106114]GIW35967.1 MAG: potassium uptake protein TrkA [Meiothermus sp.]
MNFIVVGCGRMGSGLAQALDQRGHQVTVIDRDGTALNALGPTFKGHRVVGVAFDRAILEQAQIQRADGLAAVTNSDETNIVTARVARSLFRVPRVVARVYDPRKAEVYRRLGLETISTTAWGIGRITELLTYTHLDVLHSLGEQVDLVQAEVPPTLAGRPVSELAIPGEVQVVTLEREGRTLLPLAGMVLKAGDRLRLAVFTPSADRLRALLKGGGA